MLIYMNLLRDFEEILKYQLDQLGYKNPDSLEASRAFALQFDNSNREVPAYRYRVEVSDELARKVLPPELASALKEVTARLRKGQSVRPYLSKAVGFVKRLDGLLLHWGINHLHLVPYGPLNKQGFIHKRSAFLLFFRVHERVVYLIDVLPHPNECDASGWSQSYLVRVVDRHWPQLHQLIAGVSMDAISDEDYAALRAKHICTFVNTDRGVVSAAMGVSCAGHSIESIRVFDQTIDRLERLQTLIRERYEEMFPEAKGFVTTLSLLAIVEEGFIVRNNISGKIKRVPNRYVL